MMADPVASPVTVKVLFKIATVGFGFVARSGLESKIIIFRITEDCGQVNTKCAGDADGLIGNSISDGWGIVDSDRERSIYAELSQDPWRSQ